PPGCGRCRGVDMTAMTRVGLVLGAGGFVGQAYHAGVLAALEAELGWDPRQASIVVGSSAGSLTGAALRLGVPASDLAASARGAPVSLGGEVVEEGAVGGDGGTPGRGGDHAARPAPRAARLAAA